MREIFSDNAVGYLTRSLAPLDTVIYVSPEDVFPDPIVGEEFFKLTLLGTCSDILEIVTIIENCGSCLKVGQRGADGTTPNNFSAEDLAYSTLTAATVQSLMDSYKWYLGAHCPAPTGDIPDGSYYYDTCQNRFLFWDGEDWLATYQLAPAVSAEFTYIFDAVQSSGIILPRVDIYGNTLPVLEAGNHLPEVFLNGVRLTQQVDSSILVGDFDVQWQTTNIKILDGFTASPTEIAVIVVMLHLAASENIVLGGAYSEAFSNAYDN